MALYGCHMLAGARRVQATGLAQSLKGAAMMKAGFQSLEQTKAGRFDVLLQVMQQLGQVLCHQLMVAITCTCATGCYSLLRRQTGFVPCSHSS